MASHTARPVFATTASGVKTRTATYTPFGGVHTSTGALPSARFPGQWFQSESGLHQNWMRDYDPTTGRYLQADPLGLVDGASVYGYVKQSPMRFIDPKGENAADIGDLSPGYGPLIGGGIGVIALGGGGGGGGVWPNTALQGLPWVSGVPTDYADLNCPDDCNPANAPFWNSLQHHHSGYRKSGSARTLRYYKWDYKHPCEVEVYDRWGRHLGAVNGWTGAPIKPPKPGRSVKDL